MQLSIAVLDEKSAETPVTTKPTERPVLASNTFMVLSPSETQAIPNLVVPPGVMMTPLGPVRGLKLAARFCAQQMAPVNEPEPICPAEAGPVGVSVSVS